MVVAKSERCLASPEAPERSLGVDHGAFGGPYLGYEYGEEYCGESVLARYRGQYLYLVFVRQGFEHWVDVV